MPKRLEQDSSPSSERPSLTFPNGVARGQILQGILLHLGLDPDLQDVDREGRNVMQRVADQRRKQLDRLERP